MLLLRRLYESNPAEFNLKYWVEKASLNSSSLISGDTSAGVLNRLDEVVGRHPKVVFLMIGMNDLQAGVPIPKIKSNVGSIVGALAQKKIRIILQNVPYAAPGYRRGLNDQVSELNRSLSDLCGAPSVSCLDLNRVMADSGALSPSFALDGLHLQDIWPGRGRFRLFCLLEVRYREANVWAASAQ